VPRDGAFGYGSCPKSHMAPPYRRCVVVGDAQAAKVSGHTLIGRHLPAQGQLKRGCGWGLLIHQSPPATIHGSPPCPGQSQDQRVPCVAVLNTQATHNRGSQGVTGKTAFRPFLRLPWVAARSVARNTTLSGLTCLVGRFFVRLAYFPRVAAAPQPWAGGHNAVGVGKISAPTGLRPPAQGCDEYLFRWG